MRGDDQVEQMSVLTVRKGDEYIWREHSSAHRKRGEKLCSVYQKRLIKAPHSHSRVVKYSSFMVVDAFSGINIVLNVYL